MMLKVLFYSFASGIYTSRRIERRMKFDLNTIYLSGNDVVDHSNICRFIIKYEKEILSVFSRMVYVLAKLNFINYDLSAIDGTKIKAYARKDFTGNAKEFSEKKEKIEEKIKRTLDQMVNSNLDEKYAKRLENKLKKYNREKSKIENFLKTVEDKKEEIEEKVNLTDPDAKLMKMNNGSVTTGYNCQAAVDSQNGFLVGAQVSTQASDRNLAKPMIEEVQGHRETPGAETKFTLDAGYFSSDNIQYGEDKHCDLYIPEGKELDGGSKKRKQKDMIISKDCELMIDGKYRRIKCPGGQTMTAEKAYNDRGKKFYRFYPDKSRCENCVHLKICAGKVGALKNKRFNVKYEYFETLPLRQKMKDKLSCPEGKDVYSQRACLIEHIFGTIKEYKNFNRFYHRRLQKVNIVWHIVCIAHNFRKMAALGVKL
jgi:transposase